VSALVRISFGELLDKITILGIKSERVQDATKKQHVNDELKQLEGVWADILEGRTDTGEVNILRRTLRQTNETLWEIEDQIREKEACKEFNFEFIELARQVYFTNDERARLKRKVNVLLRSDIVEEKQYTQY